MYADIKFNPLIGCLPILLQMPIFIAMYRPCVRWDPVLRTARTRSTIWFPTWLHARRCVEPEPCRVHPLPHPDDHLRGRHVPAIDHAAALNKSNPQQSRPDDHHVAHHEHDHAVDRMGRARRRSSLLGVSLPHRRRAATVSMRYFRRRIKKETEAIESYPSGQRHAPCSKKRQTRSARFNEHRSVGSVGGCFLWR